MAVIATFAEIADTFPARDLSVKGEYKGVNMHHMMFEGECAYCGEKFIYYPCSHVYKRKVKKRVQYFCKPSCMRAWDEDHKSNLDKLIDDLKARIVYLELQGKMPPMQRDVHGDIYRLIEQAEARLNTALNRKAARMEE